MKSFMQTKENIKRDWYVIDAAGLNLGRVATKAALQVQLGVNLEQRPLIVYSK